MKLRPLYEKNYINRRMNVYSGTPINNNKNFNPNNKSFTINNYCRTPKRFYRRKKDKEFNQLINNYYEDYYKFQKKHKYLQKTYKEEENFNINQYELKKKNLSVLFFTYDSKKNEELDFEVTDNLLKSMFNGKDDTLIKTTQIKNDYEMRLRGKQKLEKDKIKYNNFFDEKNEITKRKFGYPEVNQNEEHSPSINTENNRAKNEKFMFLNEGDIIIEDNYLDFRNNIYKNSKSYLFRDIIKSNFLGDYEAPIYSNPQSNEEPKNSNEEIGDGELKKFKDMVIENKYILFDQLITPHYKNTKYIPPPIFPKLSEDEEIIGFEDEEYKENFDFTEKTIKNEGNDDALVLLNSQITSQEFPMFEYLIRYDFKGKYSPPRYEIPLDIQKEIKEEEKKIKEENEIYKKNKNIYVESNINQYDNKNLKMVNDIVKDNNFPMFEQIINPYYQTDYLPPEVFPKSDSLEIVKEEENLGYDDFEFERKKKIKRNENDDNYQLINNDLHNKEYLMFDQLINSNFKGNYSPPIYKRPDLINEEEKYNKENIINSEKMKGNIINIGNIQGNKFPTIEKIVKNDNTIKEEEKKETQNNFDEDEYNDFE